MATKNRTEALALWKRVAAGDLKGEQYDSIDLHAWICEVAIAVLAADAEPSATKRPYQVTKAVGLAGVEDRHAALQSFVNDACMFDDLTLERAESRSERVRKIAEEAAKRGLLKGHYVDEPRKGYDLIRGMLPKTL